MKKYLLFVLLAIFGTNNLYSQSQTKGGTKKTATTSKAVKKTPGKTTTTGQKNMNRGKTSTNKAEELSQEYLVNNVEGKNYLAIVPFHKYYPKYASVYDVHALRTTVIVIFNFTKNFVMFVAGSAVDPNLIRNDDDRGNIILQNNIAEHLNRDPCKCKFQRNGNIFTFVEECSKDGDQKSLTHRFRYDKKTNSFFDLDKEITLNLHQQ